VTAPAARVAPSHGRTPPPRTTPLISAHSNQRSVFDGRPVQILSSREADVHAGFLPELGMLGVTLREAGEELLGRNKGLAAYEHSGTTMGIPLLYPWANRLGGFGYRFGEQDVALQGGFPLDEHGLPIHGLLGALRDWVPTGAGADEDRAWAGAELDAARRDDVLAGFPFPHNVRVDATLRGGTLTIATTLRATGDAPVPVAFGYHPYLRLPGVARAEWEVSMPLARRLELDAQSLPTGASEPVAAIQGALGDRTFDDEYLVAEDGEPFVLAGGGRRISVTFERGYPYAQVFAPPNDDVVCFEPMTAPANALRRNPASVTTVAPGSEYRARFSIAVERA